MPNRIKFLTLVFSIQPLIGVGFVFDVSASEDSVRVDGEQFNNFVKNPSTETWLGITDVQQRHELLAGYLSYKRETPPPTYRGLPIHEIARLAKTKTQRNALAEIPMQYLANLPAEERQAIHERAFEMAEDRGDSPAMEFVYKKLGQNDAAKARSLICSTVMNLTKDQNAEPFDPETLRNNAKEIESVLALTQNVAGLANLECPSDLSPRPEDAALMDIKIYNLPIHKIVSIASPKLAQRFFSNVKRMNLLNSGCTENQLKSYFSGEVRKFTTAHAAPGAFQLGEFREGACFIQGALRKTATGYVFTNSFSKKLKWTPENSISFVREDATDLVDQALPDRARGHLGK